MTKKKIEKIFYKNFFFSGNSRPLQKKEKKNCFKKFFKNQKIFYSKKKKKNSCLKEFLNRKLKRTGKIILKEWKKFAIVMKNKRNDIALYFYEKTLKTKTFNSLKKAFERCKDNKTSSKLFAKKGLLSKVFKNLKFYVSVILFRKKKIRQQRLESMKNILRKILKAWLYQVRPSLKFIKSKPQDSKSEVDKLLLKLKKKDKEIVSYFRKYKQKG